MARTLVVAQARMGSSRLPNKVAMQIAGRSLAEHVVRRARAADFPVILAVPRGDDFSWANFNIGHGAYLYRYNWLLGDDDVVGRILRAAYAYIPRPDIIVRVTCDCPFVPVSAIRAVAYAVEQGAPYAETRSDPSTRPNGIDAQAFTRDMLRRAYVSGLDKEHVTGALREVAGPPHVMDELEGIPLDSIPYFSVTVDEQADLDRCRRIADRVPTNPAAGLPELRDLVDLYIKEPEIFA